MPLRTLGILCAHLANASDASQRSILIAVAEASQSPLQIIRATPAFHPNLARIIRMIGLGGWGVSINRLLQDSAFEPEQIDRIAAAYIQVLHALRLTNRIDPLTEIVAERIFGIAQTGEVDTARITELTLKEFQAALVEEVEPGPRSVKKLRR